MDAMASWRELLTQPEDGDHIVQVYQDEDFLAEAVGHYLAMGLRNNEGLIVIATEPHWEAFAGRLSAAGFDPGAAARQGRLKTFDAEQTLSKFMVNGMPAWDAFQKTVGGIIDSARRQYGTVRAYGEMVNILWQQEEREAAARLEEMWNSLAKEQPFSLFCAYYMDNLAKEAYGGPLESLCQSHSHLIPAKDYDQFTAAVDKAGNEVLGRPLSGMLQSLTGISEQPSTRMPPAQATLLWLKKNMPLTADKVIARIRVHTNEPTEKIA